MAADADTKLLIKALAWYVHRGHPLEVFEPPLRGRKTGPSNEGPRSIGLRVLNPRAFDAIRWELMKRELGSRGGQFGDPSGDPMGAPTPIEP